MNVSPVSIVVGVMLVGSLVVLVAPRQVEGVLDTVGEALKRLFR